MLIRFLTLCALAALGSLYVKAASDAVPELTPEPLVQTRPICHRGASQFYKLPLAYTAFSLSIPSSANAGDLATSQIQLPALLSERLNAHHAITPSGQINATFLPHEQALNTHQTLIPLTQSLTKQHRAQLLLTGDILDLSMVDSRATYQVGKLTRTINGIRDRFGFNSDKDKRQRLFSVRVQLRDGISGEPIFDQHYQTYGIWPLRFPAQVTFNSPQFLKTDYGQQVSMLLNTISDDLRQVIDCQPYQVRVDHQLGEQRLTLDGGASSGLRIGDTLSLYQLIKIPITGGYQQYQTQRIDQHHKIEVIEVYAQHAIARVSNELLLTGNYIALAP